MKALRFLRTVAQAIGGALFLTLFAVFIVQSMVLGWLTRYVA